MIQFYKQLSRIFSRVAVPLVILISSVERACFSTFLPAFGLLPFVFLFFILGILTGMQQYLIFLFCIFLMANDAEHLLPPYSPSVISSLAQYLFMSFIHFLIDFLLMLSFIYFRYKSFCGYVVYKYFLPFCNFSFFKQGQGVWQNRSI